MSQRMYRYVVPVDDQDHTHRLSQHSNPVKVGARQVDRVEFWALHVDGLPDVERTYRVFGTGHPIPDGYRYVGSPEPVAGGALVWHLMERIAPPA